jgi:hypothetical protein
MTLTGMNARRPGTLKWRTGHEEFETNQLFYSITQLLLQSRILAIGKS